MNSVKVDPEAILRLYSQHTTGSVRTVEDIRKFLTIPNTRVFTAWDEKNVLQAYAVEGKGADLEGYIHEWGGGVSKLLPLIKFALQERKRPLQRHLSLTFTKLNPPTRSGRRHQTLRRARNDQSSKRPTPAHENQKVHSRLRYRRRGARTARWPYLHGLQRRNFQHRQRERHCSSAFWSMKAGELKVFDPKTAETFEKIFR